MSDIKNNINNQGLTNDDINKLVQSPLQKKMDITRKIAQYYDNGGFNEEQVRIAQDLFRTLVKDTEAEMRKTLSEAIKHINDMPKEIVIELANDIDEVSLPVLEFSKVLTDIDLIEIVSSTDNVAKQVAISKRENVSENLSESLVNTNNETVVGSLLENQTARLSEDSYNKIVVNFHNNETVMSSVIERDKLPVEVVERLAKSVSDALYEKLQQRHHKEFEKIQNIVSQSREAATMKVMGLKSNEREYYEFMSIMNKLKVSEDLIPISALCMGNFNMFEVSIAKITKVPVINVRTLMSDQSNKGFEALYKRAALPEGLYDSVELLVRVLRKLKDQIDTSNIIISKKDANLILESIDNIISEEGEVANIDYIISLIRHNSLIGKE